MSREHRTHEMSHEHGLHKKFTDGMQTTFLKMSDLNNDVSTRHASID